MNTFTSKLSPLVLKRICFPTDIYRKLIRAITANVYRILSACRPLLPSPANLRKFDKAIKLHGGGTAIKSLLNSHERTEFCPCRDDDDRH